MKILILSASTGGGHMTAANALKTDILNYDDEAVVEIVDTLKYVSKFLDKTVTEGYEYLAKITPKVYGLMYKTTNKFDKLNSLVTFINNQFGKKLMPLLNDFNPDIIITTHPFPTEMVSKLKSIGNIKQPLVCIMTDYAPHKTWLNENVDAYIVANNEMANKMISMGVPSDIIHPFGIPINNLFHQKIDKTQTLKEIGFDPQLKTLLIMAGSFGVSNVFKIYKKISSIQNVKFQIIVITGKNKKLYEEFKRFLSKEKQNVKTNLMFFTDEVYRYMQASDLIITKPGGLTISEALACNLPMAIFEAIPGQEEENADFLVRNNMAIKLEKTKDIQKIVETLLVNKNELHLMKESCESFDKSTSTENIFCLLNNLKNKSYKN